VGRAAALHLRSRRGR